MGYYAKLEYDGDDNIFYGTIEGINDSISFEGESIREMEEAFKEAVDDYLDLCKRLGKEPQKSYKGSFNVRLTPELHKAAVFAASAGGISLNQFIEQAVSLSIGMLGKTDTKLYELTNPEK